MSQLTIALSPGLEPASRRAAALRSSESGLALTSARRISFHPAFGNGNTPHYGL